MENKKNNLFVSIAELAKMLNISRIAVFKRIQKGQLPAEKIGRSYAIAISDVQRIVQGLNPKILSEDQKKVINKAVEKVVKEYGETLRLLGQE